MTEEINSEMVETTAATPEDTGGPNDPNIVIARSAATNQSNSMNPVNKIAAPYGLAMTGEDKPGEAPEKTVDAGGFKNPPLQDDGKLAELETALNETKQSLAARTGESDRLKAALDDTVSAYRKLAISSSPLYSDDIISGSTVEEIDASIKKVNGLVKKMRSTLESEFKDLTIPAGAPERSGPDLSGLSPRDKIKYGIQDKK